MSVESKYVVEVCLTSCMARFVKNCAVFVLYIIVFSLYYLRYNCLHWVLLELS